MNASQPTPQEDVCSVDELSAAADSEPTEFDLAKHGNLLMKSGRLVVLLFLFASALMLYLRESPAAAIFVGALWLLIVLTQMITEHLLASRLQITALTLTALEFQIFLSPKRSNALYLSPILRLLPVLLAAAAGFLFAFLPESTDGVLWPLLTCLCAALVSGVSIAAPIAAFNVFESLRKQDIAVNDPLSISRLARVRTLLADQSLFYGSRSAELRGFYTDGMLHPVTDLNFDDHLPLVLGFCHCDDGSLASAFGFRQSLMDVVLRGMRTTPMEHRELLTPPTAVFTPYDPEIGYVCAELSFPDGRRITYRTGKPEVLLPQVSYILDKSIPRPAEATDAKRLGMVLQNIYEIGRQAIALTEVNTDNTLTFIGYLFVTSAPVAGAESAVSALRKNGINIIYVSREQDSCAFYRASSLGITSDASRILTGARIENFRPESLERALPRTRIAAEMLTEQRTALASVLSERDGVLAAASEDPTDGLFIGADITISSPSERVTADYTAKHCKITDVAKIIRTVRSACDAAVRAMVFAVSVSLMAALFLLLTSLSAPLPPFSVPVTVFLCAFLPLPFLILIAARSAPVPASPKPLLGVTDKQSHKTVHKKPVGRLYFVWQFFVAAFGALFAAYFYSSLAPTTEAGPSAAAGAAFLTLIMTTLTSAAISYSWGNSLFAFLERKNRPLVLLALLFAVAAYASLRVDTVNALFSLEVVGFRHLPQTIIPTVLLALLYEFGLLIARALTRRER